MFSSPRRWRRDSDRSDHVEPDLAASSSSSCTVTHSRLGVKAETLGDQLPGEADRAVLEVVAEGEVAQHLEEGQVPLVRADDVDVGGAKALLHRDRARRRAPSPPR